MVVCLATEETKQRKETVAREVEERSGMKQLLYAAGLKTEGDRPRARRSKSSAVRRDEIEGRVACRWETTHTHTGSETPRAGQSR